MGLPNLFSKTLNKKNDLFILTILTDQSLHSALWQVIDQKVVILSQSRLRYYNTPDEQLIQLDESLQELGEKSEETDQILFAFEPHWVENNAILESHEAELKKLTDSLSLKGIGFVLTTEAIQQYLVKENGFLSSIILYVGASYLDLIVIRQGKTVGSLSVGRSQDIVLDVQEALARLEQDFAANGHKLPPNILLASAVIDQEKLRLYQQQLFALDWTQDFDFVQKPIIEVIAPDRLLELVTKHCGATTAQQIGLIAPDSSSLAKAAAQDDQVFSSADSGSTADAKQASFGVPIGLDQAVKLDQDDDSITESESDVEPTLPSTAITPRKKKKLFGLLPIKAKSQQVSQRKTVNKKKPNFKLIIVISVVFGLLVSALIYYFLLKNSYQVEVIVVPKTQTLQKNLVITLDSSIEASRPDENLLKAKVINHEVSTQETARTTGTKEVGEQAEGEVTIFNKTDEDKTFTKGTLFTAAEIEFELAEELTVPAASVEETDDGEGEVKEFGRAKAKLIAKEIGTAGNVESQIEFGIEDFSSNTYSARAEEDFSGGSSREIKVVAEVDHQELLNDLRQKLLKQARDYLAEQADADQYVVPTDVYQIIKEEYSHEIDEETQEVNLALTLSVQGLSYTTQDLISLAQAVLESEMPDNYVFVEEQPQVMSRIISEDGSQQIEIEAEIASAVQAELSLTEVQTQLSGLAVAQAQEKLLEQELIEGFEFVFSPALSARFFQTLPGDESRLIVTSN